MLACYAVAVIVSIGTLSSVGMADEVHTEAHGQVAEPQERLSPGEIYQRGAEMTAVLESAAPSFVEHPSYGTGWHRVCAVEDLEPAWGEAINARATLADCLAVADEVHTLTSLVGFEALLRWLPGRLAA